MEKFSMKRPVKADYIRKYGFEGERIWRLELLKYEEAKQAFDRRQANIKAYQQKIKNEEKAVRELMKKVQAEKSKSATVKKPSSQKITKTPTKKSNARKIVKKSAKAKRK